MLRCQTEMDIWVTDRQQRVHIESDGGREGEEMRVLLGQRLRPSSPVHFQLGQSTSQDTCTTPHSNPREFQTTAVYFGYLFHSAGRLVYQAGAQAFETPT